MRQKYKTICKNCIFSVKNGDVQVGCSFDDRISKFEKLGRAEFLEDGYYKIDGLCNACTTYDGEVPEDAYEIIKRRITTDIDHIVLIDGQTNSEISEIAKSIVSQTIRPNSAIFVTKSMNINYDLIMELNHIFPGTGIQFEVIHVRDIDATIGDCIDIAAKKCRSSYYSIFSETVPEYFNERVDYLLNYELLRFVVIKPKSGIHGKVVMRYAHDQVEGNSRLINGETGELIDSVEEKLVLVDPSNAAMILEWQNG